MRAYRMSPVISVVIPTRDAGPACRRLLDSLSRQTLRPEMYEVVVVIDAQPGFAGAPPAPGVPYRVRFCVHSGTGRSAARNRGAAEASGVLLVFLDDDMVADTGLLDAHLKACGDSTDRIALGYFPLFFGPPAGKRAVEEAPQTIVRRWWDMQFAARAAAGWRVTYRDLCSGNLALPRKSFFEIGGFDENITRDAAGEDWEFGYRALQMGKCFIYSPEAKSTHHSTVTPSSFFARAQGEARGHILMSRRHPELLDDLPVGRIRFFSSKLFIKPFWRLAWSAPSLVRRATWLLGTVGRVTSFSGLRPIARFAFNAGRALAYFEALQATLGSLSAWNKLCREAGDVPASPDEIVSTSVAQATPGASR